MFVDRETDDAEKTAGGGDRFPIDAVIWIMGLTGRKRLAPAILANARRKNPFESGIRDTKKIWSVAAVAKTRFIPLYPRFWNFTGFCHLCIVLL